jgi:hypothetical protein
MNKGIAHISVRGCGMFVPARSAYDREVLADHVASYARMHGRVQVLLDGARWLIAAEPVTHRCAHCGRPAALRWTSSDSAEKCCARCALGKPCPSVLARGARRAAPGHDVAEPVMARPAQA